MRPNELLLPSTAPRLLIGAGLALESSEVNRDRGGTFSRELARP